MIEFRPLHLALLALALIAPLAANADEDTLRSNLAERVPALQQIDEVRETAMPGLFEIRKGHEVLYTDANGDFLIQGSLLDTQERRNLTEERLDELNAIAFDELPLEHSFAVVYGDGTRQLAVFEDPNCPYCKRFEKELTQLDDLTVHTFLIPILGPDSMQKSRQIWCSEDRVTAWTDWMVDNVQPDGPDDCDTSALDANLEFARRHRITGTPTLIFADGRRVPGAINADRIEAMLGD